jgi:hypothetical protein
MVLRSLALIAVAVAVPSCASANTVDCGGNSFSYAEVGRAPRGQVHRGPIVVVPDSLCADLIERRRRPAPPLDIVIDPRSGTAAPSPSIRQPAPGWD